MDNETGFPGFQPQLPAMPEVDASLEAPPLTMDEVVTRMAPKRRGGRRKSKASETPAQPQPARKPVRPARRAQPGKRPRTNPLRRPKRPRSVLPDFEKTAELMAGFQPGDGPLLSTIAAQLQEVPAGQRKRVLAILNRLFAE